MAKQKRKPFEGSLIKPHFLKKKAGGRGSTGHRTKSGKVYSFEMDKIRQWAFQKTGRNKRKTMTVLAFCRNYFIKHQELPSREDLRRHFKF